MVPEWLKLLTLADAPRRCRDTPKAMGAAGQKLRPGTEARR